MTPAEALEMAFGPLPEGQAPLEALEERRPALERTGLIQRPGMNASEALAKFFDAPEGQTRELPPVVMVPDGQGGATRMSIQSALSAARGNPLAMADIVQKRLGVPAQQDEDGELYIDIPQGAGLMSEETTITPSGSMFGAGQQRTGERPMTGRFYLNQRGASPADIAQGMTEVGGMIAGAAPAAMAARIPARMALGAAGEGASSVATDLAAQAMGSEQPIDVRQAATQAAFGAGGEALAPVIDFLFRARPGRLLQVDGTLTQEGQRVAMDAGYSPDEINAEMARRFNQQRNMDDPAAAMRVAEADSLPQRIPLSAGEATRSGPAMRLEERAEKGVMGRASEDLARGHRRAQAEAIQGNIEGIRSDLAGGTDIEFGEGAGRATQAIQRGAREARGVITDAYREARLSRAGVPRDAVANFRQAVERELRSPEYGYDLRGFGRVNTRLDDIDEFLAMPDASQAQVGALETWRKTISNDIREQTDIAGNMSPQGTALKRMQDVYDDWMQGAMESAIVSGDPATLDRWRRARGLRREFQRRYKADQAVASMLRRDGAGQLMNYSPEESANIIFGAGALGGKAASARTVRAIRNALGADSPEFRALKAEGFNRLIKDSLAKAAETSVGRQSFVSAFDKASREARSTVGELFTPTEWGRIRQLRNVVQNTVRDPRDVNTSNSANSFIEAIVRGAAQIPGMSTLVGNVARLASATVEAGSPIAVRATLSSPGLRGTRVVAPGAGAAAATIGAGPANRLLEEEGQADPRTNRLSQGGG